MMTELRRGRLDGNKYGHLTVKTVKDLDFRDELLVVDEVHVIYINDKRHLVNPH